LRALGALLLGAGATLLSSFSVNRSAMATYPDIMGCEDGCRVAATGWPMVYVRDYTGMSVVNTADLFEVIFAADRFDWLPFLANVTFWSGLCLVVMALFRKRKNV
jgi:hypothetical protein